MKKVFFIPVLLMLIASCSKDKLINNTSAKINYFNWDPDSLVVDSIVVDLNNDNFDDLKFLVQRNYQGTSPSGGSYYNYFATCTSINSALKISLGTELNPSQQTWDCLEFNALISNNLTWNDSYILKGQVISAGAIGVWDTNNPGEYIGIKLESNGASYFGWIKASVNYNYSIEKRYEITCFEYAISETNNATLKAGQKE